VIGGRAGKTLRVPGAQPAEKPDRSEEEQERLNRQMTELLTELRVAMPGVQVLFAFLLAVPFQQRFETVNAFQRDVYLVTLLAAAAATAFFLAPSASPRIAFQQHEKERIIHMGTRQFVCGLVALALAMNGAVLLVTDVLFQATTVVAVAVCVAALFAWLWFGIGLWRRWRR
jgi:cation transport ATPase